LVLRPIRQGAVVRRRRDFPGEAFRRIRGEVSRADIGCLSGNGIWPKVIGGLTDHPILKSLVSKYIFEHGLSICRVHGDFSPHNIFEAPDGGVEIVDWESSSEHGPSEVDPMGFALYLGEAKLVENLRVLRRSQEQGYYTCVASLAYLNAHGRAGAARVLAFLESDLRGDRRNTLISASRT
jgi:hypothetical protein